VEWLQRDIEPMTRVLGVLFAAACLAVGLGQPASAQTLPASAVALTGGATLTTTDLTFKVNSYSCYDDGISCSNPVYMVPTSGPGLGVIIEAATGAGGTIEPYIMSFSCSTTGGCSLDGSYDLSLTLQVTTNPGIKPLTGASLAVTAGNNTTPSLTTDPGFGFGTETVTNGNNLTTLCNLNGPVAGCDGFVGTTKLVMQKDIGLGTNIVTIPDGDTISLGSIDEGFSVPEPASMGTLLVGAIALAAARRKRQRA
jgi:hypothetical protein